MNAEILSIGDELVRGAVLDRNAAFLSIELEAIGMRVRAHVVVGDDEDRGTRALQESLARSDLVIATGGLGPTEDDRTRAIVGRAVGVPLHEHPGVRSGLEAWIAERGIPFTVGHARQALVPAGAEVLANPVGTAPGFWIRAGRCRLAVLPGVPREMEAMFRESLLPRLRALLPDAGRASTRTLRFFAVPESALGEVLRPRMQPGADPEIGITASGGIVSVTLTAREGSAARREERLGLAGRELRDRFGDACFGEGEDTLASVVVRESTRRGVRFACAESCTGGLLASMITGVPGASAVFVEGAVTYANASKVRRLGVSPDDLEREGAVSEPVARAMAEGIARSAGVSLAVAITGIAGPEGGTDAKPVGTVYIAVHHEGRTRAERCRLRGDRNHIRRLAALTALDRIRRTLASASPTPPPSAGSFDIEIREC